MNITSSFEVPYTEFLKIFYWLFHCHVCTSIVKQPIMPGSAPFNDFNSVRTLEKAKATGTFKMESPDGKDEVSFNETESDTSDTEGSVQPRRHKKLKVGGYH